jgi:phosphoglycerate dehydrogenase-like enzyme
MTESLKVLSTFPFSSTSQEVLHQAAQTDFLCVTSSDELYDRLGETEVLCSYWLPDNWRELAPHLRWVQAAGAGVDNLQPTGILAQDSGVIVTTAIGINATTIGEYVIGSMLMFNRTWPEMVRLQDRHIWPLSANWYKLGGRELVDQTIGIIGLGHIGRRVAHLAAAFGMRVLATHRSARSGEVVPNVHQVYPLSQLHELLSLSDYVVLAIPLTPETEFLIGEAALRAMKPHAYLVNIARGRIIDERALLRALRERWIGGAGLDVAEAEPLPADSPLYSMPNVILTPHISGVSVHYEQRLSALFADNLQRYRSGQPLLNLYDPARNY